MLGSRLPPELDAPFCSPPNRTRRYWSTDESSTEDAITFLTQEAYDRLSPELEQLIANRPAMAKEINDRREEGDLKENGGYHAAREEQGKQEARILQLQQLLRAPR